MRRCFAVALLGLQIIAIAFAVRRQFIAIAFGDSRKEKTSRSLLAISRNHRDRFRDSEFIAIASCASRQVVAIAYADRWTSSRSLLRARGVIAIAFAIRARFIVVAFPSSRHRSSRSCEST